MRKAGESDMNPSAIRSARIAELTRMALNGKKLEEIERRALQMASPQTAKEYVNEVIRRVSK